MPKLGVYHLCPTWKCFSFFFFRRDKAKAFSGCDSVQEPNLSVLNGFLDSLHQPVAMKWY